MCCAHNPPSLQGKASSVAACAIHYFRPSVSHHYCIRGPVSFLCFCSSCSYSSPAAAAVVILATQRMGKFPTRESLCKTVMLWSQDWNYAPSRLRTFPMLLPNVWPGMDAANTRLPGALGICLPGTRFGSSGDESFCRYLRRPGYGAAQMGLSIRSS